MSVIPIQKIRLLIHRDKTRAVMDRIQKLGFVQFTPTNHDELEHVEQHDFDYNYDAGRLDFAVTFLAKYEDVSMPSKILEGTSVHASTDTIHETVRSFDYEPVIDEVQQIEADINSIDAERGQLDEDEAAVKDWVGLSVPLEELGSTEHTFVYTLTIEEDDLANFRYAIHERGVYHYIENIGEQSVLVIGCREDQALFDELIAEYNAEHATLPSRSGTPRDILRDITDRRQELTTRRSELEERATELTGYLPSLRMVADYMHWKKNQVALPHEMGLATSSVYVLEGWCPEHEIDTLYHDIDEITHAFELERIEVAEDEDVPVALENKKMAGVYESVTRLYGVPSHKDLDPTFWVTIFFFVFFGLCLTDVGYGLFLAAVTGLILLLYRVQPAIKQLLLLLMLGGVSSMIVGLFFGGYFGVSMDQMPQWLQDLQYFDPINSPLPFFYLTLALGYVQVVVGFILDIVRKARHETLRDGVLDSGPWLLGLAGIALYIGGAVNVIAARPIYVWMVIAAAVLLVLTQGRKEQSLIAKAGKGLVSLYDSVGYFADVLSYSRLLALGLATSALAFSVNMIADLVGSMIPVVGPLVMVIVLVVGHTFNLVVNTLGAYIHTARLQFVEFFNKFLTGTGTSFQPFKRVERHVRLTEK